jgi:hypothetical protein
MAIFNEILHGRFNRALQRGFGIKGSPPVRQLGGEIMPIIAISSGRETLALESWSRYMAAATTPANAANTDAFRLRVPRTSNVIAVVEKLMVSTSVAGEVDIAVIEGAVQAADLGTIIAPSPLDQRQNPLAVTVASITNVTTSALGVNGRFFTEVNKSVDLVTYENQEIPLVPTGSAIGDALIQVTTTVANLAMTVWVIWRERYLEDMERSLS